MPYEAEMDLGCKEFPMASIIIRSIREALVIASGTWSPKAELYIYIIFNNYWPSKLFVISRGTPIRFSISLRFDLHCFQDGAIINSTDDTRQWPSSIDLTIRKTFPNLPVSSCYFSSDMETSWQKIIAGNTLRNCIIKTMARTCMNSASGFAIIACHAHRCLVNDVNRMEWNARHCGSFTTVCILSTPLTPVSDVVYIYIYITGKKYGIFMFQRLFSFL